jgi:hypothetical protein
MKNPDRGIFLGTAVAVALGIAACGGPMTETPKPSLATPSSSASPDSSNNAHWQIAPCATKMPWEVSLQQNSGAEPVIIFASMKKPQPTTRPRIQPECWKIVPNGTATANPSQTSR